MRRRSFRPALESLDLRITPTDLTVLSVAAYSELPTSVASLDDQDADQGNNPYWNEPADTAEEPDDGRIWCPPIGG